MIFELFELIVKLIAIGIYSIFYSAFVILILYLISKWKYYEWLENRMNHKLRNFFFLFFIFYLAFYNYSFSYWQDTGKGENPSIPIGYGQRIYSPDFAWTVFFPDLNKTELNKDELQIENFLVEDNMFYAKISHQNSNSPNYDFIVYNLEKRTSKTFLTEAEYNQYATLNKLPLKDNFLDFKTHYNNYFDKQPKWKKWLLP